MPGVFLSRKNLRVTNSCTKWRKTYRLLTYFEMFPIILEKLLNGKNIIGINITVKNINLNTSCNIDPIIIK